MGDVQGRLETVQPRDIICHLLSHICQLRYNNWINEILGRQRSMVGECFIQTAYMEERNPHKEENFPNSKSSRQQTVWCSECKSVPPLNLKVLPLKSKGLNENCACLWRMVPWWCPLVGIHSGGIWYHYSGAWWLRRRQHDDDDNIHDDDEEDYDDGWPCCRGVG